MIRPWFLLCLTLVTYGAQDLPDGIIAGHDYSSVPIPPGSYQVYLIGEFHGAQETKSVLAGYLVRLHQQVGLRDLALEEDQVYQSDARDYVDGKAPNLPSALCLRADVLNVVRQFNNSVPADQRIQVHLVDIDSPLRAIRQHLLKLKDTLGARTITIPDEQSLREAGSEVVDQMAPLAKEYPWNAELETIRSSIAANREGVEIGTSLADTKGNVLVEAREEAIARNMINVLKNSPKGVVLGFYGVMHARKRPLGQMPSYKPLGLRLTEAGVNVASISCEALSGNTHWRGMSRTLPLQAGKYLVFQDRTMEEMIATAPGARFFWLESAKHEQLFFMGENLAQTFDFVLFIKDATPMRDTCAPAEP